MVGGARNGYCSKLRRSSVAAPSMTVRIAITIATMGRRMKKFATTSAPRVRLGHRRGGRRRRLRFGLHLHPGPDLLDAVDDHSLSGLHPRRHDVEVIGRIAQRDGPCR